MAILVVGTAWDSTFERYAHESANRAAGRTLAAEPGSLNDAWYTGARAAQGEKVL